jgi:predicted RND superfamily exporter protein/predicted LPLAT superfamily acyltransferase
MTSRRWLWLLLLIPIIIGFARLHFDVEVLDLLPPQLATVQGLKLYQQHFANARELIITVKAPDAEQAEAAARAIAERLNQQTNFVSGALWQPPWLEHPGQAAELLAYLWLNQPPEDFAALNRRLSPEKLPAALAEIREGLATSMSPGDIARSSYDPFGLTRLPESATGAAPSFGQGHEMFSSPDGTFRIIFVQANRDLTTYRECALWLQNVRNVIVGGSENLEQNGVRPSSVAATSETNRRKDISESNLNTNIAATEDGRIPSNISIGYTGRPAFVAEIATGMERDITTSVGATSVIIAVLFWLAHRRWKPMLWLLTLLALILASTLALGGLIFGTISVISMGFAAILLGLAVDYAVVHYQEALAHPKLTVPEIRHAIAPSIFWAAVTSITAFLVLNFGELPGLAQLGSLVGVGIALSACVMIFAFLPPLFPERRKPRTTSPRAPASMPAPLPAIETPAGMPALPVNAVRSKTVFVVTGAVLVTSIAVLLFGLPRMDPTANALRPRNSSSYAALEEVKNYLNQKREPLWLLIGGRTEAEVAVRLSEVEPALARAVSNNLIGDFKLPTPLWPRPEYQIANRTTATELVARRNVFRQAALTNGFAEPALGLTDEMLNVWQRAADSSGTFWPTNPMSQWIFQKVVARSPTNYIALGFINPTDGGVRPSSGAATSARSNGGKVSVRPGSSNIAAPEDRRTPQEQVSKISSPPEVSLTNLESELPHDNVLLSGWELLGKAIFSSVKQNMWKLIAPMIGLILLSLCLAFRRPREVLLSLSVLAMSGLCLLTVMRLAGWSWNLLNLMALPLILGTGVDYSIFMQLALRRYSGDLAMAYRSVGRALLLCGATAIAGFGSLAWSSNAGMASLGVVCAVGIAGNMLISVLLLPVWWKTTEIKAPNTNLQAPDKLQTSSSDAQEISRPSFLYCSLVWRFGLWLVRVLPEAFCVRVSRMLAVTYQKLVPRRRAVVVENLLPAVNDDPEQAEAKTAELFQKFALKLLDLWRYEAGLPVDQMFGDYSGWQYFLDARAQKRGVLLVTPHLGNWEFGGPALRRHGIPLQVITLEEPGRDFTRLRLESRARQNIETIVIGSDPFVFVDIIRRLESGAVVALLIDRPSPPTAVTVELFGRPFPASIAAAELARASGCIVMPVYILRTANGYGAHIMPEIPYDRVTLRDRSARQKFTQELVRAFEPVIRENPEQWYHFVPVWTGIPTNAQGTEREVPKVTMRAPSTNIQAPEKPQ